MTTTPAASTTPDPAAIDAFLGKFVADFGAALAAPNVVVGERLGLYAALAELMPATPADVAAKTQTDERYVREWLSGQAAGGYVEYDAATERFSMTPEQVLCLADDTSPAYLPGAFQLASSLVHDADKIEAAFRSGAGLGWHEHHHDLFHGTERLFRPGYAANLVSQWVPALDGVADKLTGGGAAPDVGCGHGASTILLAQAHPKSILMGFDYHRASIDVARKRAAEAGVADRVRFEVASAQDFPGTDYDLVCIFDALHDMGDPPGAARHIRDALAPDGTWLLVEPMAGDCLEDNVNPVGRIFYAASATICTPGAQAQDGGYALGNQV